METGSRNIWGEDQYLLGEPIFAPRSVTAAKGDSYILMLAYDQATALSQLMIFDAQDIESGPLARAKLPVRIPSGFHGTWVGACQGGIRWSAKVRLNLPSYFAHYSQRAMNSVTAIQSGLLLSLRPSIAEKWCLPSWISRSPPSP
jgi:hypothetical protein